MTNYGISPSFEEGKECSVCGERKKTRVIFMEGDDGINKFVRLCKDCANDNPDLSTEDLIEEYGEEAEEKPDELKKD